MYLIGISQSVQAWGTWDSTDDESGKFNLLFRKYYYLEPKSFIHLLVQLIVLSVLIAISIAAPTVDDTEEEHVEPIPIISSEFESNLDGGYSFSYESADGTFRQEKAIILNPGEEDEKIAIVGNYRYNNDAGQLVEVSYTSDDKGFQPTGTIIHPAVAESAKLVSQNVNEEYVEH